MLNDVRGVEVAAIGNCSGEVGNLQRSGKDFALPDSVRDDCVCAPSIFAVHFVIEFAVRR